MHSHLLLEAAKHGVALIFCEKFKPVSLLLPANRSSDTLLTKAEVRLDAKKREALWRRTIDAKCTNQAYLAGIFNPDHPKRTALEAAAKGRGVTKESTCARYYWNIFGDILNQHRFKRAPGCDGVNSFLNYGYAILTSMVLQKLLAVGLDPTFGIAHAVRERSAPLAYDLMEPFRPCVDRRVIAWLDQHPNAAEEGLTKEFRRWVTEFTVEKVCYFDLEMTLGNAVESVIRSFRRAVLQESVKVYKPWTATTTKWVG